MKITKVEAFAVQAQPTDKNAYWGSRAWGQDSIPATAEISTEYPTPFRRRALYSKTIDTVVVRLSTDDDYVGYGEAKAPVAPQVTKEIIDQLLAPIILGMDPGDITVLWELMFAGMRIRAHRMGFYMEAMSGVDIALWDLMGKTLKVPVYRLLGGSFRPSIRVYASALLSLPKDAPDEEFAKLALGAQEIQRMGYTGLKIGLGRGIQGDLKSIRRVRDMLGSEFLLYADAGGVYDRAQAMLLGKELEDLGVGWFEMPIFPEDIEGYVKLAKGLKIPIALDSLTSRYEASEFIRRGGLDIVQPDVCRAGGITECRRIAELADTFGLGFSPHISIGSAIHVAATTHLASAMPNTITSEYWIGDNPIGNSILKSPLILERGYLQTPTGPGLGIEILEGALSQ